jgi:hypothetical protein
MAGATRQSVHGTGSGRVLWRGLLYSGTKCGMKTPRRVSLGNSGGGHTLPGGRMGMKDAKYLVGCKGTENRNVDVCVCVSFSGLDRMSAVGFYGAPSR